LNAAAMKAGIADHFKAFGIECSPAYACRGVDGQPSAELRTLFNQEMIKRGILMPYIAPSFAHDDDAVSRTIAAAEESLVVCARSMVPGGPSLLDGPPTKPVFRKFN